MGRLIALNKEYIDREAAKNLLRLRFGGITHAVIACRLIDAVPAADVVEVVRCKDCDKEQICKSAQYLGESGFCSYGERKDNG